MPARSRSARSRSGRSTRCQFCAASSSIQLSSSGQPSCGPGPASGWNCTDRAFRSGKSNPSTVPSYSEIAVASESSVGVHRESVVLRGDEHAARTGARAPGWFAPRWPKGSLKVSCPVARPSSWWPRQIPKTGVRPRRSRTTAVSSTSGSGSPGPFERTTPSWRGERVGVDRVRVDRHRRARSGEPAEDRLLRPVVDDRDVHAADLGVAVRLRASRRRRRAPSPPSRPRPGRSRHPCRSPPTSRPGRAGAARASACRSRRARSRRSRRASPSRRGPAPRA